jgi:DNA invertase Pin-like site-specific DNA recombinase
LEAQRRAIVAECKRRGWELVEPIEDRGFSAKDMKRPGVQEALRVLEAREASALVVAKLDRLSRSMIDFTALMA